MSGRSLVPLCAVLFPAAAFAQPITHPIWASTPGSDIDAGARTQFTAALAKRGLGVPETVALPAPPATPAVDLMARGMAALAAAAFDKAASVLGEAARAALATGGAGLEPGQAASLFFHQAVAIQLASGATYSEPFTAITPSEARAAYLRAAVLGGGKRLDDEATQPLVEASWRMAKSLVANLPTTRLTVKGRARATISVDGRAAQPSPAAFADLSPGEHFVRVEEPGHAPYAQTVTLGGASNSLEVPGGELLVYPAAVAAESARAHGAAFALVGQLHLAGKPEIDLRLVDTGTGAVRDTTAVPLAEGADSPDLIAAVLRLDELASKSDLARRTVGADGHPRTPLSLAPPPARAAPTGGPELATDAPGWLRLHWPLATAVGTAIGTTLALGIVVAKDHR
jgi:hypothetical protein